MQFCCSIVIWKIYFNNLFRRCLFTRMDWSSTELLAVQYTLQTKLRRCRFVLSTTRGAAAEDSGVMFILYKQNSNNSTSKLSRVSERSTVITLYILSFFTIEVKKSSSMYDMVHCMQVNYHKAKGDFVVMEWYTSSRRDTILTLNCITSHWDAFHIHEKQTAFLCLLL